MHGNGRVEMILLLWDSQNSKDSLRNMRAGRVFFSPGINILLVFRGGGVPKVVHVLSSKKPPRR